MRQKRHLARRGRVRNGSSAAFITIQGLIVVAVALA
jgi:hypothetical protein